MAYDADVYRTVMYMISRIVKWHEEVAAVNSSATGPTSKDSLWELVHANSDETFINAMIGSYLSDIDDYMEVTPSTHKIIGTFLKKLRNFIQREQKTAITGDSLKGLSTWLLDHGSRVSSLFNDMYKEAAGDYLSRWAVWPDDSVTGDYVFATMTLTTGGTLAVTSENNDHLTTMSNVASPMPLVWVIKDYAITGTAGLLLNARLYVLDKTTDGVQQFAHYVDVTAAPTGGIKGAVDTTGVLVADRSVTGTLDTTSPSFTLDTTLAIAEAGHTPVLLYENFGSPDTPNTHYGIVKSGANPYVMGKATDWTAVDSPTLTDQNIKYAFTTSGSCRHCWTKISTITENAGSDGVGSGGTATVYIVGAPDLVPAYYDYNEDLP